MAYRFFSRWRTDLAGEHVDHVYAARRQFDDQVSALLMGAVAGILLSALAWVLT